MKTRFFKPLAGLLLAAGTCAAQLSAVDYKSDDFAQFLGSKTYVVQTGNAEFDQAIAQAMQTSWKATPFDVITNGDLKSKLPDKSASFILSLVIGTKYPNQNYHYLALINGGKKRLSAYRYDDMIAYCPINHFQNEPNNSDCHYRVRNMIESMAETVELVQKNDLRGNSKKIVDGLRDIYKERAPGIKDRTLLFCKEAMGMKLTQVELAGLYPHRFEICSLDKIKQVIAEKNADYYYFQPTITLNKSWFVFDPVDGKVMYFDYQMMGMNINEKNIKALAAAIAGGK